MNHLYNFFIRNRKAWSVTLCFLLSFWQVQAGDDKDLLPPVISFTPLPDVCATGDRTLVATITDADGVPTSGAGLPVLYFRINVGPWTPVTAVSLGSNQYSFTFGASAIVGNIVSYYIVAQDNASTPNVGAQPSAGAGGFTSDPPAASTAPTSPNFYVIQPTLSGTYTVGATGTFLTITDAVNAYNNSCLGGPVIFALTDAAGYGPSETFPITIYNPAASATNTLTIKPNVNTTITGSSPEALFKLYGSDYVTIEGSTTIGGTTRNLTITNTNTSAFSSAIWLGSQSASNGATNNIIRNCRLGGNSGILPGATTYACIISGNGNNIGFPAEAANSNNTFRNNVFEKTYVGIHLIGGTGNDQNNIIERNVVGSTVATNYLGYRGIWAHNQSGLNVSTNTVNYVVSTLGTGSDTDPTAGIIVTGATNTANIQANTINNIRNTNVAGWQAFGIALQSSSTSATINVYNNMIYAVTGNGRAADAYQNGHGIGVLSGGNYNIWHNSVHLIVNQSQSGITSALYIGSGVTGIGVLNVRNNIFSNRQTTGTRYSVYSMAPNTVFSQIDYNCYYTSQRVGFIVTNHNTLAAWQIASGGDLNSNATNPIFVSNVNLRLQLISPLNDLGTPLPLVTTDIDGLDVRSATTPDFGCDEIFPPACSGNTPGTITASRITLCFGGSVLLSSTGFSFGLGMSYQWESSTDNVTFNPIPGETNPTSGTPPAISVTTYYRLRVACSFAGGTPAYSNVVTVTVQTPVLTSNTPGTRCGPGTVNLGATSSPGTVINWFENPTGGESLGTGTSFTTPVISANTTYYAEASFAGSNGWAGPISPTAQGGVKSLQFTSWEVYFNVLQSTTLISIDVFPQAALETSTLTINRPDGTVIATIPYVTTVSGGETAQTIPINVPLDPGVGYYLYTTNSENGLPPSGLMRNITGAVYPYTSSDIEITGNGFNNTFFMCYYRWRFSNSCAAVRVPVTASITSAASISVNATPTTLCIGSSTTLTASSSNTSFTYTWTPGSVNGSSITVSPTSSTKYVVNASDGSCTSKDSIIINVVSAPSDVLTSPASITKCSDDAPTLLSSSGGITQVNILSEDFNAGLPSTWTIGSTPAAAYNWTNRPNNYAPSGYGVIRSNDSSPFMLTWSAGNSATKTATMMTPAFSTSGITNASVTFFHHYARGNFDPPDSISVDASLNGSSGWVSLRSWTNSRGTQINFRKDTVVLTPAFLNQPTVYIRFRFVSGDNFGWAVDNVSITGNDQQSPITWAPLTGLYTDAAGTIPYTGSDAFNVYAFPSVTTTYVSTATGLNGCEKTDTAVVEIRPPVTGTIGGNTAVCPSGAATISIALTGTAPWSLTYTDGATPVSVSGINTSPYTFVVNPLVTTSYSITALADAFCTAPPAAYAGSATVTVNPTLFSTWLGLSTDWSDPTNWCGGVPTNLKDVVIPGALPFYPLIIDNLPVTRNLQIEPGATVTIQAGASLAIHGDVQNDGTIQNNGSIVLTGGNAQNFPGGVGSITAMHTLEINKSASSVTLNRDIYVQHELKPVAGSIILTDTVTIGSNAGGTARIDQVGPTASFTYNGAGAFTVERYIPTGTSHGKSWQLLAAPTKGQTVKQAWQEGAIGPGVNPKPGYGTTFTSDLPGALGLGFDFYTPLGGSSIRVYNSTTNQLVGIPNTNTLAIANANGYMLFVRGDRSVNTSAQPAVPVTLRTTGKVYAPGVEAPPSIPVGVNKLESVGNPYASAIDFLNLRGTSTGLDAEYYVWDPLLYGSYGFGGYQTFSSATGYLPVPGNTTNYPSIVPNTRIQSGQAFFVHSTPGGTVNFAEGNKVAGSQQVFRQGMGAPRERQFLRAYLYTGTGQLADGNVVAFDRSFNNMYDADDAKKLGNFGENFGIQSEGYTLAVEARQPIMRADTIHYQVGNLRSNASYKLLFVPVLMQTEGLQAWLVDRYRNQYFPVSLSDETEYAFEVNAEAGSKAGNRFYIVFDWKRNDPPLYSVLSNAIREKELVHIHWSVDREEGIRKFEIEKSGDGQQFSHLATQEATGSRQYSMVDTEAGKNALYYRVKLYEASGNTRYGRLMQVASLEQTPGFAVYPNPVKGQTIGISFQAQRAGRYQAFLYDAKANLLMQKTFQFAGGGGRVELSIGHTLADGMYLLELICPDGRKLSQSVIVDQ